MLRLTLLLLLAACLPSDEEERASSPGPASAPVPFALVELFTSEGCSSCPPADALLGDLAGRDGVVALAFHVDYWDYLGWRDPYADAAYTQRQRAYGRRFDGRVYTPQMVVNGAVGFVGSRRQEAERHIGDALAQPAPVTVSATVRPEGDGLAVAYEAPGAPEDAVLHLAVAERTTAQEVRRGENQGRRLAHTHVVRTLRTVEAGRGTAVLPLPDGLTPDDVRVAAWVQEGVAGPVLGAAWAGA